VAAAVFDETLVDSNLTFSKYWQGLGIQGVMVLLMGLID
jgi:hypothetical protein